MPTTLWCNWLVLLVKEVSLIKNKYKRYSKVRTNCNQLPIWHFLYDTNGCN